MTIRTLFNVLLCSIILPCGAGCTGSTGVEVTEAVWVSTQFSAGLCLDECVFTLSRTGTDLELRACTHENVCRRTNLGTLTAAGLSELEAREDALTGATLEDNYGCPDCDDGGATTVKLNLDGQVASPQYESRKPPAALNGLDGLVRELYTSLNSCTESPLVEIDSSCQPES
jgi:hypothetical protein